MKHQELIEGIQQRVATVAIGASTVRGQGVGGIVSAARCFLSHVRLERFGVNKAEQFFPELDKATDGLMKKLPKQARSWGLARKCLNIFLRDAFYNYYLRDEFDLILSEGHYEIPLDRIVAKKPRSLADSDLPRWAGVKRLKKKDSAEFQAFAQEEAMRRGISRVHLDTFLWRHPEEAA